MIILFSSSFFKTGCIFYPLNKTCFSKENISWSKKDTLKSYSEIVTLWAKGYQVQDDSKYEKINDQLKTTISKELHQKVSFAGRLANYTYINQDQAIAEGFHIAEKILNILK